MVSGQSRVSSGHSRFGVRSGARVGSIEHLGRSDLDGGIEGDRVWMTCSCGAVLVRVVAFS
jgi:hypothetical protein